jgi:hypothetical protein
MLILIGTGMIVFVDSPRRILRQLAHVNVGSVVDSPRRAITRLRHVDLGAVVDSPRRATTWLGHVDLGALSFRHHGAHVAHGRRWTHKSPADVLRPAPSHGQDVARYQHLSPGWYRDAIDHGVARYWDGTALSTNTRPLRPTAAPPRPSTVAYQGLPSAWYRDPQNPRVAHCWNGSTLSDARPLLAD